MRMKAVLAALAIGVVACGGGDTADEAPPAAETPAAAASPAAAPAGLTMPAWIRADNAMRHVTIDVTAGETNANNYWNFNGLFGGSGEIIVPQGYEVTLNLTNRDPAMAHSVGVSERQAIYPPIFEEVVPAFEGAVTADPTSMTDSTLPGESESITFTAGTVGEYVLLCYVTGHAATGMWVRFTVAEGQEVGVLQ